MPRIYPNRHFIAAVSFAALAMAAVGLATAGSDTSLPLPAPVKDSDYLYDGAPPGALVELGRNLFFDPILSGNRNISCGTCHDPQLASGDGLALGIGEGGDGAGTHRVTRDPVTGRVPRNAQALWNVGAKEYVSLFHDGRVEVSIQGGGGRRFRSPAEQELPDDLPNLLTAQAFFPVASPIEMAGQFGENPVADAAATENRAKVWDLLAARVADIPAYFAMMQTAFQDLHTPKDATFAHIAEALAAFQSTAFRSDNAPFDRVLRTGDTSHLSPMAQAGLSLFYGKARCATCHSGPFLTDHGFHAIAVPQIGPGKGHGDDLSYWRDTGFPGRQEDEGRYRVTLDQDDLFAFRTPSLRNVALTGPWGHSGAFDTLEGVIRHHLHPEASLTAFNASRVELPKLDDVLRMSGRGTQLGFVAVDSSRRAEFDMRDRRVMETPKLRDRILTANQLAPIDLTDTEVRDLVAFLKTLTDQTAENPSDVVPLDVPSGLPPQPRALPEG
ncbi:cytochrome-c peroxidase [uncultured Tateyamaria sp.]|uniref:cytochrome-c peroxidase n=1 Tax=uncultured Tateyamaria sp. TaxID=455651 RepID=UPI002606E61C|nr:cytochrome c peroxidase [uncultured Tateyamaria sp.]